MYAPYLNTHIDFWGIYHGRPGAVRRGGLIDLFMKFPDCRLPVNRKHQPSSQDPDLKLLMKRKFLKQIREGGLPRSRQTYLVKA